MRELIDQKSRMPAEAQLPETAEEGASVSADMAAIFGNFDLKPAAPAQAADTRAKPLLGAKRPARYRQVAMLAVPLVAAGLAGAALFDRSSSEVRAVPTVSQVAIAPPAPKVATARIELLQMKPAGVALQSASEEKAAAPAPKPAAAVRRVSIKKPVQRQRSLHGCTSSRDRSRRCLIAMEREADRELRAAYLAAVRAGAPRRDLVAVRNAWADARREGSRRPMYLVTSYSVMSRQLRGLASDARSYRD